MAPELSNETFGDRFYTFLREDSFSARSTLQLPNLGNLELVRIDDVSGYAEYAILYQGVRLGTINYSWMPGEVKAGNTEETISIWGFNEKYLGPDGEMRYPLLPGWTMNEPEIKTKLDWFYGRYYQNQYIIHSARHASGATFKFMFIAK